MYRTMLESNPVQREKWSGDEKDGVRRSLLRSRRRRKTHGKLLSYTHCGICFCIFQSDLATLDCSQKGKGNLPAGLVTFLPSLALLSRGESSCTFREGSAMKKGVKGASCFPWKKYHLIAELVVLLQRTKCKALTYKYAFDLSKGILLLFLENWYFAELIWALKGGSKQPCHRFRSCLVCESFALWSHCFSPYSKKSASWLLVLKLLFPLNLTCSLMIMLRLAEASWASVGVSGRSRQRKTGETDDGVWRGGFDLERQGVEELLLVAFCCSCNHDATVSWLCGSPAPTEGVDAVPGGRIVPPARSRKHKFSRNTAASEDTGHEGVGYSLRSACPISDETLVKHCLLQLRCLLHKLH